MNQRRTRSAITSDRVFIVEAGNHDGSRDQGRRHRLSVGGFGSSEVLKEWAQWPTLVSPTIVAIAFLFSGAVGVFFGFYPAKKAAGLDPIDALRYE
jgi:ABC-type lipoprotein release transport system permease subunit